MRTIFHLAIATVDMDITGEFTIKLCVIAGLLLVLTGIIAYVATGFASVTALFPAAFGVMIVLLGVMGRSPSSRRRSILGIGLLALLLVLGSLMGVTDFVTLLQGGEVERPTAVITQMISVVLGAVVVLVTAYFAWNYE